MLRKVFASLAIVCVLASASSAAIIGSATLVKNPPGTPFNAPDAALGSPWQSYILSVTADAGETIQAVQAVFTGSMHQRWDDTDFDDDPSNNPTGNGTNKTGGDTHLLAPTGSLFGSGPTENNPGTGSPLSAGNSVSRMYGVGNSLTGAWSLTGASVGSSAEVAYLVINPNDFTGFNIEVKVANPLGETLATLTKANFPGLPGGGVVPTVGDLALVADVLNETVTGQVTLANVTTLAFDAINTPTYVPLIPGKTLALPNLPTLDNAGNFSWNTAGAKRGLYTWAITGTGAGTDGGFISVEVQQVPEPATFAMVGLAMVGFVGCARRRS
jgi:hypothetical protein